MNIVIYFNSIKVRLELAGHLLYAAFLLFQFHKGAIRTIGRAFVDNRHPYFNSIKVRLELTITSLYLTPKVISIP